MTPNGIRLLFADLSKKAGITHVHPSRFRHTYATEFLRNGGSMLALKAILGHSDLKMCQRYAEIALADVKRSQNVHSVVSGWKLKVQCSPNRRAK
jgi:site-specific recombinase XerD